MKESNSIPTIMIKDHCKIEKLLDELEENVEKEYSEMKKTFNKLEWELEKHLFIEEKAIFTEYQPEDIAQGYKMLPEITKQHNYILNKLNNWRREIQKNSKISGFYDFKKFLIKHKNFEEKEVYPRLDETLNDTQKKHIISKINEIAQK
jgi:hypothetical protein